MRVVSVSLRSTEAAEQAGRVSLTPELLAATGARYSRSNEGLDQILSRIDPDQVERSVDSIFRMIDYGHQSIADMAPVAMFIDGISMWLAYYVWTLCPTAGGQESSTRYIRLSPQNVVSPASIGLPEDKLSPWNEAIKQAFSAYSAALGLWENIVKDQPELARIPAAAVSDKSERGQRALARMNRNFGFDRARVFIPAATSTNMMLLMSARGWVHLCQTLLSHPLKEPTELGCRIREELALVTPRLIKHAEAKGSIKKGLADEFARQAEDASKGLSPYLADEAHDSVCPSEPQLEATLPPGVEEQDLASSLKYHDNRYAWIGEPLRRTGVRFGWNAVAFAEIRDLNRHRTGTKYCPLLPLGFYYASEQLPNRIAPAEREALVQTSRIGQSISRNAAELLAAGDPSYVYWALLGTQFPFEHVTTADKFVYEAELRTGAGAHFRYAQHLHDVLAKWYDRFPSTRGLIVEGAAEPE